MFLRLGPPKWMASAHQEISDGRLALARFRRLSGFRKGHGDLHAPRDAGCNLILRRRASDILPLEAVRPDLQAIGSVDQLNVDDGARSFAPDPAFYDVSNSELSIVETSTRRAHIRGRSGAKSPRAHQIGKGRR